MVDIGCHEPQVRGRLALYVAGRMAGSDQWAVEEHLAHCATCLRDSAILGEAALAVAALTPAERDAMVAEFGAAPTVPVPPSAVVPPAETVPQSPARAGAVRRPPPRPSGSIGPRPSRAGRAWRRRPLLNAAAGVVVLVMLATGIALGRSLMSGPDSSVVLVADSQSTANGAVLSVTVSRDGGDTAVRAAVSGLRAGESYRFYITDTAGTGYDMAGLTGSEATQDISTGCPVPLDRLDRFSVTAADGALVVTASVRRNTGAPAPHD